MERGRAMEKKAKGRGGDSGRKRKSNGKQKKKGKVRFDLTSYRLRKKPDIRYPATPDIRYPATPDIRPDIRYPAFGIAGYPAKSVSGASLLSTGGGGAGAAPAPQHCIKNPNCFISFKNRS